MTYQAATEHPNGTYSIYFGDNQSNFQPFQGPRRVSDSAVPQPQASAQANTYYAGQGTHALLDFKTKCESMWLGWVAYKAGQRYYEMHADAMAAAEHGAHVLRRWFVWLFFTKVWLGSLAFLGWMLYVRSHEIHGESFPVDSAFNGFTARLMIFIAPALLALLVVYARNIDFGLSKRNVVYRLVQPIVVLVTKLPNWVLYLIVLLPLFSPFPAAG